MALGSNGQLATLVARELAQGPGSSFPASLVVHHVPDVTLTLNLVRTVLQVSKNQLPVWPY